VSGEREEQTFILIGVGYETISFVHGEPYPNLSQVVSISNEKGINPPTSA
jgi:hypothetical protein